MNDFTNKFTWVFGLTADPIHRGHEQVIINTLKVAEQKELNTQQFLLIPTYQPNLIADKTPPLAGFNDRMAMCELVAKDLTKKLNTPITVSDIEQRKLAQQTSYTYDTLDALSDEYNDLVLIISSDHAHGHAPKFRQWHRWDELIKRFGLMIHERPGYPLNDCFVNYLKEINPNVYVAKNQPTVDISSTRIRQAYAYDAKPTKQQLNPQVAEYIQRFKLYQ